MLSSLPPPSLCFRLAHKFSPLRGWVIYPDCTTEKYGERFCYAMEKQRREAPLSYSDREGTRVSGLQRMGFPV